MLSSQECVSELVCLHVCVSSMQRVKEAHIENESVISKLNKDHLHLIGEQASKSQPSTLEQRRRDTYT